MNKLFSFSFCCVALAAGAAPVATVTSVDVSAENRQVTVNYSLSEDAVVTFDVLTNSVSVGGENLVGVVGDVNRRVAAGSGMVAWCWPKTLESLSAANGDAVVRVTAWPLSAPPDYMAVSMLAAGAVSFYPDAESVPGGIGNDLYKTEMMLLRRIPAKGVTWLMGSPSGEISRAASGEDRHSVTFTNDYYIGVYEMTQRQYELVTGKKLGVEDNTEELVTVTNAPTCPVDGIRWAMTRSAAAACNWVPPDQVSRTTPSSAFVLGKLRALSGCTIDLPTEAEWEYACRAGTGSARYDGSNDDSTVDGLGWHSGNSGGTLHPVGLKEPNAWGLYDMYGNVAEWCLDWYSPDYGTGTDGTVANPTGPHEASPSLYQRVTRGGSVSVGTANMRSASRFARNINTKAYTGFRVVALDVLQAE